MYLFILCLITYKIYTAITAEIITFTATAYGAPTIFNDSIALIVELSNCSLPCSCNVQTNKTGNFTPVNFFPNKTTGIAHIVNLQPYTMYSFDMNCSEVKGIKTYSTRTDIFRPSPPRNTQIKLINQHLQLKWSPPTLPQGPIDEYHVIINNVKVEPPLNNTQLSYEMTEDYDSNRTYTMSVYACNTDTQNRTLCSAPKDATVLYFSNQTTTDSSTTPPTQSATIHHISVIFILIIQIILII